MALRKITIDNSVRYVPKTEKPKKRRLKQKLVHFQEDKTKIRHKTIKDSLKFFQHQDLLHSQISIHINIFKII